MVKVQSAKPFSNATGRADGYKVSMPPPPSIQSAHSRIPESLEGRSATTPPTYNQTFHRTALARSDGRTGNFAKAQWHSACCSPPQSIEREIGIGRRGETTTFSSRAAAKGPSFLVVPRSANGIEERSLRWRRRIVTFVANFTNLDAVLLLPPPPRAGERASQLPEPVRSAGRPPRPLPTVHTCWFRGNRFLQGEIRGA